MAVAVLLGFVDIQGTVTESFYYHLLIPQINLLTLSQLGTLLPCPFSCISELLKNDNVSVLVNFPFYFSYL